MKISTSFSLICAFLIIILSTCGNPFNEGIDDTIYEFVFENELNSSLEVDIVANIDDSRGIITAEMPPGTSLDSLIPTISIHPNSTISPASGSSKNFSSRVTYTVTASDFDKTTKDYSVRLSVEPPVDPPVDAPPDSV